MIDPKDYIDWAKSVARRFRNKGLDLDDLEGEAMVGLLRACEKFDPTLGVRFELYAEWWIGREIRLAFSRNTTIQIPYTRLHEARAYVRGKRTDLSPTKRELLADAVHALGMLRARGEDVMEDIIDHFDPQSESYDRALALLANLEPIESEVIQLKLGLDGARGLSYNEVRDRMGLANGLAPYWFRKGLRKLKALIEDGKVPESKPPKYNRASVQKVTPEAVAELRALVASGLSLTKSAKRAGISTSYASHIMNGKVRKFAA